MKPTEKLKKDFKSLEKKLLDMVGIKKLSVKDFCYKADMSQARFYDWRGDKMTPSYTNLMKIAERMGL